MFRLGERNQTHASSLNDFAKRVEKTWSAEVAGIRGMATCGFERFGIAVGVRLTENDRVRSNT